jgi:hypothetical protein
MGRRAAFLLLTAMLAIGHAAAAAFDAVGPRRELEGFIGGIGYDDGDVVQRTATPEPLPNPPTCPVINPHTSKCIKTMCNKRFDGSATVKVDIGCLFGEHKTKFMAMSYTDMDNKAFCITPSRWWFMNKSDTIILYKVPCKSLLKFILKDVDFRKNPKGKGNKHPECQGKITVAEPETTCSYSGIPLKCYYGCKGCSLKWT